MPWTIVELELRPAPSGTELVLVHRAFDSQELCDEHEKGWTACLARLPAAI